VKKVWVFFCHLPKGRTQQPVSVRRISAYKSNHIRSAGVLGLAIGRTLCALRSRHFVDQSPAQPAAATACAALRPDAPRTRKLEHQETQSW
jgi:hypothetical protein